MSGVVLRTLPRVQAQVGDLPITWDGRTDAGAAVYSGKYVAEVTATNTLGPVTLGTTFGVHRVLTFSRPAKKK
jgi:flagellar hook assembly protein FlgD